MKDYKQVANDVFRKRDIYLAKRKKRIAYMEKAVPVMSMIGVLVTFGLCTGRSSSITSGVQDKPSQIDLNSDIGTVTAQTDACTAASDSTAASGAGSMIASAASVSTTDRTILASADVSAETAASAAVRNTQAGTAPTGASAAETTASSAARSTSSVTTVKPEPEYIEYAGISAEINRDMNIAFAIRERETLADTVYVDSEELEKGDYVFKAAFCVETEDSLAEQWYLHSKWDAFTEAGAETPYVKTENLFTYMEKWNDNTHNAALKYAYSGIDPYVNTSGGVPYSAGAGRIYIEDEHTGEPVFYDLTIDEKTGTAYAVVPARADSGVWQGDCTVTIHHYDPETPYGEPFMKEVNQIDISCISGIQGAWVTEQRGAYYEMGGFDVVIDEDTPDGVYYLRFTRDDAASDSSSYCVNNNMSGSGVFVIPRNVYSSAGGIHYNASDYCLRIVVGDVL